MVELNIAFHKQHSQLGPTGAHMECCLGLVFSYRKEVISNVIKILYAP